MRAFCYSLYVSYVVLKDRTRISDRIVFSMEAVSDHVTEKYEDSGDPGNGRPMSIKPCNLENWKRN